MGGFLSTPETANPTSPTASPTAGPTAGPIADPPTFKNENFGYYFKQWCCKGATQFPKLMAQCEDQAHDVAARLGSPSSIDAVFTCSKDPTVPAVTDLKIHAPIYDHTAVQCTVNGVRILTWNLEGLCDAAYNAQVSAARKAQAAAFFNAMESLPQVLLFQELYLRSNMPKEDVAKETVRSLLGDRVDQYYVYYAGFTGCTCVATELGSPKPKFIPRPNEPNKKSAVVKAGDLYVVNVHLKAIQMSVRGTQLHLEEVGNILRNVQAEVQQCPVVFLGDHNTPDPKSLYMNAPNLSGGKRRRKSKRKSRPRRRTFKSEFQV